MSTVQTQISTCFHLLIANSALAPCCGHTVYMNYKLNKKKKIPKGKKSIVPNLILIFHWNTILQSDLDGVEAPLLFLISEMKSHYCLCLFVVVFFTLFED